MSTDRDDELTAAGVPELTPLGKRIEHLRLERRMSKRILAHRAGTSRQQLWRVMTGKSELTSSLCARLSEVLEVDSRWLREAGAMTHSAFRGEDGVRTGSRAGSAPSLDATPVPMNAEARLCQTLEEYISGPSGLERTFETLPITDDGRRLKRVLLDAIEDIAIDRSIRLPQAIFDLRRAVVNDDA
jgi:transcriptional regulator with XRE-family HTH domain